MASPSKLKRGSSDGFVPEVQFPVFTFNANHLYDEGCGSFLEQSRIAESLHPPPMSTFSKEFIFQKSSEPHVCYLFDPEKYPPNNDGYKKLLGDLKTAATLCGEDYTSARVVKNSIGEPTRYQVRCCLSRTSNKTTKMNQLRDDVVYRENSMNNTRKYDNREEGHKGEARRRSSKLPHVQGHTCACKCIDIYVGKKCLFLHIASNIKHTNHLSLHKSEVQTHLNSELKSQVETMSYSQSSGLVLAKGMTKLHNGEINTTQAQMKVIQMKTKNKANAKDKSPGVGTLNTSESAADLLQGYGCRVIILKHVFCNEPKKKKAKSAPSPSNRGGTSIGGRAGDTSIGGSTSENESGYSGLLPPSSNGGDTNIGGRTDVTSIIGSASESGSGGSGLFAPSIEAGGTSIGGRVGDSSIGGSTSESGSVHNGLLPPSSIGGNADSNHSFFEECIEREDSLNIPDDEIRKWVSTVSAETEKKHLICLAWLNKDQFLLANAFARSVHIDATHNVCEIDNLCLLTITVKDSSGKTYVVARFWIPNQRVWMFKYILFEAIPTLFGLKICRKIRSIVSDGDPHLIKMIDAAIKVIYTRAVRVPCSWHLSDRAINSAQSSWRLHHGVSEYVKIWFCRFLQSWLGTFMIPGKGIESASEYQVSKSLLLGSVNSQALSKIFDNMSVLSINSFLSEKIFPYESTFMIHLRKRLFNGEQHSNSGQEGTNNASKNMKDNVEPGDSLVSATDKVTGYDRVKLQERRITITNDFKNEKQFTKVWNNLILNMSGVVEKQKRLSKPYVSSWDTYDPGWCVMHLDTGASGLAISKTTDETEVSEGGKSASSTVVGSAPQGQKRVTKKDMNKMSTTKLKTKMTIEEKDLIQPKEKKERDSSTSLSVATFLHVWKVTPSFDEHGNLLLFCDCCMDDRCGTICRHKFHVFEKYLAELGYTDFDYRSVHCLNWSAYAFLGARTVSEMNEEQKNTWGTYQQLVETGFAGTPCFHPTKPQKDEFLEKMMGISLGEEMPFRNGKSIISWYSAPAHERVLNFSYDYVCQCMKRFKNKHHDSINMSMQLSQGGFDIDSANDENLCHAMERDDDILPIITANSTELMSANEKENECRKILYGIMNSTNFNSTDVYEHLRNKLEDLQKEMAAKQTSMVNLKSNEGQMPTGTEFPDRSFGRKQKRSITKQKSLLK